MADPTEGTAASDPAARSRAFDDEDNLDLADYLREAEDDAAVPSAPPPQGVAALTLGALGVVYGDIGTSPIYAFREALRPALADGLVAAEVFGLLSLLIWTLILIVTVKYVLVLLRADNRGEGGVLALYTLARLAIGHRSLPVLLLAIGGAALFAGDAMITPAISVLSAVEGLELLYPGLETWVLPITAGILVGLFAAQAGGTARVAVVFGPLTALWFLMLAGLGVHHILQAPEVLRAFDPLWAVRFLQEHRTVAFIILGAVFLAVTGAEALYADLGHFGKRPIRLAWFGAVFPALVLNYLGQGALVLRDPAAVEDPFFHLAAPQFLPLVVAMATIATVIASQAVISGAFSMARGALQLGLLPRMRILHTSHGQSGQIYIPAVNWILLFAVLVLVFEFGSSTSLASAYGIAVTGTMLISTALLVVYVVRSRRFSVMGTIALAVPIAALELAFLASNLTKFADGGYVPVLVAAYTALVMWAWWSGTQGMLSRIERQKVDMDGFAKSMLETSAGTVPGTAFFLTPDPSAVPSALLHNLKHNRVLHEKNVILTVETLRIPVAPAEERVAIETINDRFQRLVLRFGFMETPNVTRALVAARKAGLKFDVMTTTFFLGRRRPVVSAPRGLERMIEQIYALFHRLSADPSDYYHLPRDRVVELGERVAV